MSDDLEDIKNVPNLDGKLLIFFSINKELMVRSGKSAVESMKLKLASCYALCRAQRHRWLVGILSLLRSSPNRSRSTFSMSLDYGVAQSSLLTVFLIFTNSNNQAYH